MSDSSQPTATLPSAKLAWFIAAALAVALAVAVVALAAVLWRTAATAQTADKPAVTTIRIVDVAGGNETAREIIVKDPEEPTPLPNPAVHQPQQSLARSETVKLTLQPGEKTEIKAVLAAGKMILYSWNVQQGNAQGRVYSDFHGHDPATAADFWVRYQEHQEASSAQGSLVAPFDGEHGWYWVNVSEAPVDITLNVQGFQKEIVNHGLL